MVNELREKGWEWNGDRQEKLCHSSSSACLVQQREGFSACVYVCVCVCLLRCVQVCLFYCMCVCLHLHSTHSSLLTRSPVQTAREAHLAGWCVPGEVLWPGQGESGKVEQWRRGGPGSAWSFPLSKKNRRGRWRGGQGGKGEEKGKAKEGRMKESKEEIMRKRTGPFIFFQIFTLRRSFVLSVGPVHIKICFRA